MLKAFFVPFLFVSQVALSQYLVDDFVGNYYNYSSDEIRVGDTINFSVGEPDKSKSNYTFWQIKDNMSFKNVRTFETVEGYEIAIGSGHLKWKYFKETTTFFVGDQKYKVLLLTDRNLVLLRIQ